MNALSPQSEFRLDNFVSSFEQKLTKWIPLEWQKPASSCVTYDSILVLHVIILPLALVSYEYICFWNICGR